MCDISGSLWVWDCIDIVIAHSGFGLLSSGDSPEVTGTLQVHTDNTFFGL